MTVIDVKVVKTDESEACVLSDDQQGATALVT